MTPDQTATETITPEHPLRWRMLAFWSVAMVLSMTVWFSTNAIAPALEAEKGFSTGDIAWLTIAVQIGFVIGTMLIAVTNVARFRYHFVGPRPESGLPEYDLFFRRGEPYKGQYDAVDYILLRGDPPEHDASHFDGLDLVRSEGPWRLYRRKDSGGRY